MERRIHFDISNLNALVRSFLMRISKKEEHSTSLAQWLSLYRLARRNRVESCFSQLEFNNKGEYHAFYLKMIEKRIGVLSLREQVILEDHREVCDVFKNNGLFPVYFKGFALSMDEQISHRTRFYEDIDFLIDSTQASHYLQTLFSLGYTTKFHSTNINPLIVLANLGSLNLYSPKVGCCIDLHISPVWTYFPQVLRYEHLIANARCVKLGDRSYFIPSLTNHALILLLEGTKDMWFRIDKLLDFYFCFLNLNETDLEEFDRLVTNFKLIKMLNLAKYLLVRNLEFDWSEIALGKNALSSLKGIAYKVTKGWEGELKNITPLEPHRTKSHLQLIESSHAKLSYFIKRASVPTENDFRTFLGFTRTPYLFFILRPLRKLLCMMRNVVIVSRGRLLWH